MQKRVFLHALSRITPHRKDITARHIVSLVELAKKGGSKTLSLPGGIRACKEYDVLTLKRAGETADLGVEVAAALAEGSAEMPEMRPVTFPEGERTVELGALCLNVPFAVSLPGEGSLIFTLREAASSPQDIPFYKKEQNIAENRYTKWFDYDKITKSLTLRPRRAGDYLTIDGALHTQSVRRYMINEKIPRQKRDGLFLLAEGSHVLWVPGYRDSSYYRVDEKTKRILEVQLSKLL